MAEETSRGEIFVVDDDPAVRDTLSMVLTAAGYEVICFADGAALLVVARSRIPGDQHRGQRPAARIIVAQEALEQRIAVPVFD